MNSLNLSKTIFTHLVVVAFASLVVLGTFLFPGGPVSATEALTEETAAATTAGAVEAEALEAEHGTEPEAEHGEKAAGEKDSGSFPVKPFAAALVLGLGAMATAMVQMKIGVAGAAAIAEKPEVAPMFIVLVALPETIVILGFVVAAMILMF